MEIRVFITGGTIDGIDAATGKKAEVSSIPGLLRKVQTEAALGSEVLMLKDSSEITFSDREIIAQRCKNCEEDNIIITHGSNTMVETGKFLLAKNIEKTILLTGAMIPASETDSDALPNLSIAIEAVLRNPVGVYVAMNSRLFSADNVRKNFETGVFEAISDEI